MSVTKSAVLVAAMLLLVGVAQGAEFRVAYGHVTQCNSASPTSGSHSSDSGLVASPIDHSATDVWEHRNWAGQYLSTSTVSSAAASGSGAISLYAHSTTSISGTMSYTAALTAGGADPVVAEFLLHDVVLTNQADPGDTSTWVDGVKLNVHVRGLFAVPDGNDGDSFTLGYYRDYWLDAGQYTSKTTPYNTGFARGVFRGLPTYRDVDGVFSINLDPVRCGTPFSIGLRGSLMVTAKASTRGTSNDHQGEFEIGFSTEGPVFDLPSGYTMNSPSGNIISNLFVPEPATLSLLSVAGLVCLRRRRHVLSA